MNELNSKTIEETNQTVGFATALKEPTASWDKLMTRIAEDLKKPQLFDAQCYADFSIDEILLFLRRSHDFYLAKKLPEIEQQLVHLYTKFPEYKLFRILYLFFQEYKSHLMQHISHEENTLFKYADYLLNNSQKSTLGDRITLLQGSPSLNHFLETHTDTEKDLSAMRKVLRTEDSYRQLHPISMLLHQLATLENHLNIHARIEDEVFVPKALKLEEQLIC